MKDAFHGSARPAHGLVTDRRDHPATIIRPYRGTTSVPPTGAPPTLPRSGFDAPRRALLRPAAPHRLGRRCALGRHPLLERTRRRWAHETVPAAYRERYDTHVRPAMPNNPVSLKSLVAVAEARASFAEHRTGPQLPAHQRPTRRDHRAVRAHRPARVHRAAAARGGHRGDAGTPAHPRRAVRQLAGRRPGPRVGIGVGPARQSDSNAVTPSRRV